MGTRTQADLLRAFSNGATSGKSSNMFIEGDTLFSFGHHFPLAVRRERGWGAGIDFLINGDRYSPTTSHHTMACISQLVPNVQIPFSALESAGFIQHPHSHEGREYDNIEIVGFSRDETFQLCKACGRRAKFEGGEAESYEYKHEDDGSDLCGKTEGVDTGSLTRYEHLLGGVVLRQPYDMETISDSPHGRRTVYSYWLSATDPEERWSQSAYFLCELPRPCLTVERAFASLKPRDVRLAEKAGLEVLRQGDIYFIQTRMETRDLPGPTRRMAPVWWIGEAEAIDQSTHVATEVRKNGQFYVRGIIRHRPPRFRRPQHAPLKLTQGYWYRVVKNRASQSFSAEGRVD